MKRIVSIFITLLMLPSSILVLCNADNSNDYTVDPDQIRKICGLATVECYFTNIAKSTTSDDHFYTKNSDFWFTYSGSVKVGLASNVSIQQDGNTIIISLPQVEMLDVSVSYPDDESIIRTSSGLFYADVSSEDITQARDAEEARIILAVSNNAGIRDSVLSKAKLLIQNYVSTIDELSGDEHSIVWQYSNGTAYSDTAATEDFLDLRVIP